MGTTYQAQVEVFQPPNLYRTNGIWQAISRWELQKDYMFALAWSEVAEEGWPTPRPNIIGESLEDEKFDDYEQRYNADGSVLELLELHIDKPWPWFIELKEHVSRLIKQGYMTRVITWGE